MMKSPLGLLMACAVLNGVGLGAAPAAFSAAQEVNGLADPTALNSATSALGMAQQGVQDAANRNAVLLGFARSLQRERQQMMTSTAEITMSNELNEERYFVILMAYDNQTRLKERKSRLMRATRLSVRSPGNNFTEALPALTRVGSEVFGRQVDGLVRVQTPLGRGTVTSGELEVLGQASEKIRRPSRTSETRRLRPAGYDAIRGIALISVRV